MDISSIAQARDSVPDHVQSCRAMSDFISGVYRVVK
jgi:hypothetical protein